MNYRDMQKPLVQTALVLLAILVVIGFVAGSDANSFFGGLVSIVKGAIYTVLFAFALVLGLVFSVILLIAIFLGAVSLYSSEKAKEMYASLRQRTSDLYLSWTNKSGIQKDTAKNDSVSPAQSPSKEQSYRAKQQDIEFATATSVERLDKKISSEIGGIKQNIDSLKDTKGSLVTSLETLQQTVSSFPGSDLLERIDKLEAQQAKLGGQLEESLQKLEMLGSISKLKEENNKLGNEMDVVRGEIDSLNKGIQELKVSISEPNKESSKDTTTATSEQEEHRIFAYLEKDGDKKQFIKCVAEAVKKDMTYAEIDTFLSKSLSKRIDTIIKEHPSLTKEYIRDCKNS